MKIARMFMAAACCAAVAFSMSAGVALAEEGGAVAKKVTLGTEFNQLDFTGDGVADSLVVNPIKGDNNWCTGIEVSINGNVALTDNSASVSPDMDPVQLVQGVRLADGSTFLIYSIYRSSLGHVATYSANFATETEPFVTELTENVRGKIGGRVWEAKAAVEGNTVTMAYVSWINGVATGIVPKYKIDYVSNSGALVQKGASTQAVKAFKVISQKKVKLYKTAKSSTVKLTVPKGTKCSVTKIYIGENCKGTRVYVKYGKKGGWAKLTSQSNPSFADL